MVKNLSTKIKKTGQIQQKSPTPGRPLWRRRGGWRGCAKDPSRDHVGHFQGASVEKRPGGPGVEEGVEDCWTDSTDPKSRSGQEAEREVVFVVVLVAQLRRYISHRQKRGEGGEAVGSRGQHGAQKPDGAARKGQESRAGGRWRRQASTSPHCPREGGND